MRNGRLTFQMFVTKIYKPLTLPSSLIHQISEPHIIMHHSSKSSSIIPQLLVDCARLASCVPAYTSLWY
jgi:hypothetical protein